VKLQVVILTTTLQKGGFGMEAESGINAQHTVLVVADDQRVLLLAQAVLAGKGHRVLLASDAQRAIELLSQKDIPIHSVAIRAAMRGHEEVRNYSLRQGAKPWTVHCDVDARGIRLEGQDSGAEWESAADIL
jgi:CheY-like chemotaxis protein